MKTQTKTDLNQISLTGARAIALLGLLMIKPRSLEEIRRAFINAKLMEETHSNDILRIDLNTLKYMGCNISRASQSTGYKYVLKEHPFSLKVESSDIRILKRVYDEIKINSDLSVLFEFHRLFDKIALYVSDEKVKEEIKGISILKRYNLDIVDFLVKDCRQERIIKISYINPSTKKEQEKEVIAQKILIKNDKLFLFCYDTQKEKHITLNISRIAAIISRSFKKGGVEPKLTKVKFHLTDFGYDVISDEENIIEVNDKGYVIEGNYYSDFLAMQRVLSFGSKCTILGPEEFKEKVINKLKEMRKVYER